MFERRIKNLFLLSDDKKITFFYSLSKGLKTLLRMAESGDGMFFKPTAKKPDFGKEKMDKCSGLKLFKAGKQYFLTYEKNKKLYGASSLNLTKWELLGQLSGIKSAGAMVPDYLYDEDRVMYTGGKSVKIAYSVDLKKWRAEKFDLLKVRKGKFDSDWIMPAAAFIRDEGIVLVYYALNSKKIFSVGMALFNKDNPEELLWRSEQAAYTHAENEKINPISIIEFQRGLIFYFENGDGNLLSASLPPFGWWADKIPAKDRLRVKKYENNPILGPRPGNRWDSFGVFNPTVFTHDDKIYILYRAIGDDNISVVGLATSRDGLTIEEQHEGPIYIPRENFEGGNLSFNENEVPVFGSGGGWGGCEDPKIVKIGDRIYITYVAFNGWAEPNIALSSISVKNFMARKWSAWKKPVLITNADIKTKNPIAIKQSMADRPGSKTAGDKNPAILPEKVRGKYVIFHRLWPNIVCDYVDSLNFDGKNFLKGANIIPTRPGMWDSKKIGIGGSPLRIKEGWLLIYNGVDKRDAGKYKIGAMILDANDPAKVLYRCRQPILEPEEAYENHGHKYGVVFAGGSTIKDGKLFVYYGGSDKYCCVATADLDEFINKLKHDETPKLSSVKVIKS
jgi:beta-1,2-mannobiose phosphorylase / 1,2-beta-oligomannan phosphorylase